MEIPWSDVQEVQVLGDMLTISLGRTLHFLVPQRGFTDPADYHALRDNVLERDKTR